ASLQDHLIELISVLVESMSAMEPQTLQYMQFHTDRLQISNEELESTRLKLSQQSPLQDALDQCLDALQAPACAGMVPEVVRNLAGQTKSGVGLATRVTAVRSLMFIINSDAHAAIPQSTTQKGFRSLISSVVPAPPPSVTLKKEMVASLGALSRICDSMFLTEMVSSLMTINRKSGVDNVDLVVTIAECIHQIISKAGDAMQEEIGMWNEVISCSYIGSFDEHEEAKMTWEKVLSCAIIQSTLGTKEAAIKAVLGDILRSVVYHLYHQSWIMRTQAISVLKDMLLCIPSGLVAPNTAEVMVALLRTLPGQMWRGKDASLRVIAQLLEKCPQCLDAEMSTESLLRVVPVPPVVIGPDGVSRESKRVDDSQTLLVIALSDMTSRASLAENITSRLAAYHKDHQLDLSNTVNPQQSIFPKCSAWRLSWTGIITLLLQESERTDRQYRLAAAASLSALPWNAMKSPAAVLSILPMIGRILQCAGMPTSVTGIVDTLDSTDKNSSDLSTAEDAANKPARRTNYDMFGGRYGGDSVPDNRKKGIKRARVGRPDENSTLAIAAADPLLGDGEDASDAEGVVEDTLTVTAPEGDAVTNDAVSTSYQMSASDAAFRVKFLETAAALWPNHNMFSAACQAVEESVTDAKSVPVADVIQMVRRMPEATVDWALLVVRHEVWSVRKAVLLLLQAMVNAAWPLSNAAQAVVLDIISVSLDDNKYSQVRAAAASTLLKLIAEGLGESGNYDSLDSDAMKSKLNSMVSRMSLDTNPAVILSYASIQKKWASRGQL
ncbi:ECPAS, partial [Symbiodinium microadriaticum]